MDNRIFSQLRRWVREGIVFILLALAVIILVATMWPVISKLWSAAPRGLDARFYNRVCLPLGALLVVMMEIGRAHV